MTFESIDDQIIKKALKIKSIIAISYGLKSSKLVVLNYY